MEHMSTMTTPPIPPPRRPSPGAVASGAEPGHRRHVLGDALHAIRVFAGAALSVVVLGDTGDKDEEDAKDDKDGKDDRGGRAAAREPGHDAAREPGHGPDRSPDR
ncbi:hypothetical protein ADZ36_06540 [Streptomyces fradiae]|uniref:Uncharacterized protein n=3 Tax=Streptomyces TaxID=1883 RepID=A0A3R7ET70_9ACTN|nr:hypothetical protein ADZ36_06540 [Streptomyces fradiae]OFA54191.1 hypothetical protein BEN35_08920 [Streptomyces fradiae]PQM20819.1 hypothetical protein Sfr7A_24770 [Streptomyces xinghaiensis]RKM95865.1 hypothetical protein SFRA_012555 [Streptomyces xinghaiensis]RNC70845.1 hypothetical protein DC095_024330 [Streptomyces xinghaiensis]